MAGILDGFGRLNDALSQPGPQTDHSTHTTTQLPTTPEKKETYAEMLAHGRKPNPPNRPMYAPDGTKIKYPN